MCLLAGASLLCTGCSAHKRLAKSPTPAIATTTPATAVTTENSTQALAVTPDNSTPAPADTPTPTPATADTITTTEATPSATTETPTATNARTRNNKSVATTTPKKEQPQESIAAKEPTPEAVAQPDTTLPATADTILPARADQPDSEQALPEETHESATYLANTNTLNILNWSIIIILLLLLLVAIVIILIQRKKLKDAHEREDYLKSRLNSPAVMQAEVAAAPQPQPEEPEKELINSSEEHDRLFGAAPTEPTEAPAAEPEQVETTPAEAAGAEAVPSTAEEAEETTHEPPVAIAETAAESTTEPASEPTTEEGGKNEATNAQAADNQPVAAATGKALASQAMLKKLLNERVQMEQPFKTPNQIKAFMKSFNEAYPDYMSDIKQNHPEVTDADALVIAFMINELNIQQICVLLNSKPRTVWSRRLRIKTHLGLTQNDDLDQWVKDSI